MVTPTTSQEQCRAEFEAFWLDTRGKRRAYRELKRHHLQPQTYVCDSANRHWTTWQACWSRPSPVDRGDGVQGAVMAERRAIWEMLSGLYQLGPLQGDGCDRTAQRNGVILAQNAILARPLPAASALQEKTE